MTTDAFGTIVSNYDVEAAALTTIELWLESYISAVERRAGFDIDQGPVLPRPGFPALELVNNRGQHSTDQVSIYGGVDSLTGETAAMPLVIVTVKPDEDPTYFGSGDYTVSYELSVYAICIGQDETLARLYAQLYGAATSTLILQNGDLGGLATRTRWLTPPVVSFADTEDEDDNLMVQALSTFTVYIDGSVNDMQGIDDPVAGDTLTNPDPTQLPPSWPTITAVNIAVEAMNASADTTTATFTGDDTIEIELGDPMSGSDLGATGSMTINATVTPTIAPWALVQKALAPSGLTGTSGSLAFGSETTAGNLLIAIIWANPHTLTLGTPTDTVGNTWVPMGAQIDNTDLPIRLQAWATINKTSGANTVALSWTGGSAAFTDFAIAEFSGGSGTLVQDGAMINADTSGITVASPTFTPTATGDLLVFFCIGQHAVTSVNSPWTQAQITSEQIGAWGWTTGSLSPVAANATVNGSGDNVGVIFGIKP